MFHHGPANNEFLHTLDATANPQIAGTVGLTAIRRLRVTIDFALEASSDTTKPVLLLGNSGGWFLSVAALNAPNATYGTYAVSGATVRNSVTKTATYASDASGLFTGRRTIVKLVDDATAVTLYLNGKAGATAPTWTIAQANPYSILNTSPLTVGGSDGTNPATYATAVLRLYELQIEANGLVVCHLRPKTVMTGLTTLPDLSGRGNTLALSGAEATDFTFERNWNRAPEFSGKETVR